MKAIGIILAGGNNDKLGTLTQKRALCAMPIGSSYRAIDFPLSNMTNSGIGKVAIITQYNSRSLHDHLSSAKWWNMGRKQGGLFVFSPYISTDNSSWYRGTADSIFQNISYLERSNEPYVVIASGNSIYKLDYSEVIRDHIETESDISIVYSKITHDEPSNYGILTLDKNKRLLEFEEKPLETDSNCASTGIYVISRILLIKLLKTIIPEGRYDIVEDIIVRYRKKLKITGYEFSGYWKSITNTRNYYDISMDFLKQEVRNFFTSDNPHIYTKPKDLSPAKYNHNAVVKNTLTGSGCIIEGNIENSILSRGIVVGENTIIKDSIILESSYIGKNCVVEYAIIDKEVILSDGKQVIGTKEEPVIIEKGTVI
jgi:glucose-1-phosphate adenylyltransferase